MSNSNSIADRKSFISEVARAKATAINKAYTLYDLISASPEKSRPELLEVAADNFRSQDSAAQIEDPEIPEVTQRSMAQKYGAAIHSLLNTLVLEDPPREQFYARLWSDVVDNSFFPDKRIRAFALYYILSDSQLPYFHVEEDALMMSDDEFNQKRKELADAILKLRFLALRQFKQRTQRADLLLRQITSVPGHSDQVFLMTMLLVYEDQKLEALYDVVDQITKRQMLSTGPS